MFELLRTVDVLSARARMEDTPVVDVSSKVLYRLAREVPTPVWPMGIFATASSLAAAVVLGFISPLFELFSDPWSALFLTAANVLR